MRDLVAEIERRQVTARIGKAREQAGLTQAEIAEALHVKPRTYQNYESVKTPRVPWGQLDTIAKLTGTTKEWLIHGDTPSPFGDVNGAVDQRAQLDRIERGVNRLLAANGLQPESGDEISAGLAADAEEAARAAEGADRESAERPAEPESA